MSHKYHVMTLDIRMTREIFWENFHCRSSWDSLDGQNLFLAQNQKFLENCAVLVQMHSVLVIYSCLQAIMGPGWVGPLHNENPEILVRFTSWI